MVHAAPPSPSAQGRLDLSREERERCTGSLRQVLDWSGSVLAAEFALQQLAGGVAWQRVYEYHALGHLEWGQGLAGVGDKVVCVRGVVLA